MRQTSRYHGHAAGPQGMKLLAERDRARSREDVIHFVVALVRVRRSLGDLDDVDIGDAALAARYDPLDMSEQTFNGPIFVAVVDQGCFYFCFFSPS